MIAKAMLGIMPELTLEEALETTKIHSVAGLLPEGTSLVTQRPFRSPHHTISYAGLIGGACIHVLERSLWRIMVFCSWTNFRNSHALFWKCFGSL